MVEHLLAKERSSSNLFIRFKSPSKFLLTFLFCSVFFGILLTSLILLSLHLIFLFFVIDEISSFLILNLLFLSLSFLDHTCGLNLFYLLYLVFCRNLHFYSLLLSLLRYSSLIFTDSCPVPSFCHSCYSLMSLYSLLFFIYTQKLFRPYMCFCYPCF